MRERAGNTHIQREGGRRGESGKRQRYMVTEKDERLRYRDMNRKTDCDTEKDTESEMERLEDRGGYGDREGQA